MKKHVIKKALQALANAPANALKVLIRTSTEEDADELERLAKALNLKVNKSNKSEVIHYDGKTQSNA